MGQQGTVPAEGVAPAGAEGPGAKRGGSSLRESRTQGSLVSSHLQRCGPSHRSHHGAAVSHLLQELQQGQILISRTILQRILGGLRRDRSDLPCPVPTTVIGTDITQGLQTPRVTSARANHAQHPAHLAQHGDVCQRAQKPKSHREKTPVSKHKSLLSPVPGFHRDGSSRGSARGCRAQGSPGSHSPALGTHTMPGRLGAVGRT